MPEKPKRATTVAVVRPGKGKTRKVKATLLEPQTWDLTSDVGTRAA